MTLVTLTGAQAPTTAGDTNAIRGAKAFSDAIQAIGMVKTADTGQIDWSAVVYASTTNTLYGYEIFRFADSQQAGAPIFFKIFYYNGSPASHMRYDVQVGTGSDGAGVLTGQIVPQRTFAAGNPSYSTTNTPGHVSGDSGRIVVNVARAQGTPSAYQPGGGFIIERLRSPSGATTDHFAVIQYRMSGVNVVVATYVPRTGPINVEETLPAALPPGTSSSLINGTDNEVALAPSLPFVNGRMCAPLRSVLTYYNGDISFATAFTCTMETVANVFMPLGNLYHASRPFFAGGPSGSAQLHSNAGMAVRFD